MTTKSLSLILKNPKLNIQKQKNLIIQVLKFEATTYTRVELNNFKEIKREGNDSDDEIETNVLFIVKKGSSDYFWYSEINAEVLIHCDVEIFNTLISNCKNITGIEVLMSNESDNEQRRKKLTEEKYEIEHWKVNGVF